ncbi:unnamed protein product [Rotaria socialis]|uniref:Cyclic nucleotide-binding domain-containing protein n=1 Tax=Rotaria socialis TaxID=392032 RepID=A0A817T2N5_9BILA|nr:unnamed protein product [Rotaria socialis]CAF3307725.1 unnamed protein product [Rotaria socialis]CAF3380229.1 unnamed protein product [Rotaria socialis]CAF3425369.1 unnamed protein product [Rotaria socialis]CAF3474188.1 unnamed protein product [Rotaria socialis]
MASPLNRRHRRTAPYVIMNNNTQLPAVAYSARQPDQENSANSNNGIQILTNTPLEQPQQEQMQRAALSLFDLVRRAQRIRRWMRRNQEHHELPERSDSFLEKFVPATKSQSAQKEQSKTWVIDPSKTFYYYWSSIVSLAVLYNCIMLIGRSAFLLLQERLLIVWLIFDYLCDVCYIVDTFIQTRRGYLEQGLIVRDITKLRKNYMRSRAFILDLISLLPTDFLYFVPKLRLVPALRFNRLFRIYRTFEFSDKVETQTNHPNVFRLVSLLIIIMIIIHWNACFYFIISRWIGYSTDGWVYNMTAPTAATLTTQYLYCFFWSTLVLTNIGEVPPPETDIEVLFVTADFLTGVLIFATIVGNVGSIIASMNAVRADFRQKVDQVKQYMVFRKVGKDLERRVITWFDYLWLQKQVANEDIVLGALPQKLRVEIAIHVHLAALKRVPIFAEAQPGLLVELVTRLKLQIFSPGDYVCKKGDIGKEMYIIKRGRLSVVSDDGTKIFVTLEEGSVFGEISILNIPGSKTGNRRTANIRSVGYSDLFCLTKQDLWEVLAEYPSARDTLIERGKAHLRKDNLLDEEAAQRAQQDEAAIPEKVTRLEGNIDNLETRLARLMGEYTANMTALGQRLQTVEKLAVPRRETLSDEKLSRKNTLDVIGVETHEDDV